MFPLTSTHSSVLLDTFRIPYEVVGEHDDGPGRISAASGRPLMSWPRSDANGRSRALRPLRLGEIPLFVHLERRDPDGAWTPVAAVSDAHGDVRAFVYRNDDGSFHLPFDPHDAIENLLSESYGGATSGSGVASVRRSAFAAYYAAKPHIPRSTQLALRRRLARVQARRSFPRWPVEDGLHQLYDWLLGCLADAVGSPLPGIAPWPQGRLWSLVLTHDVEQLDGYRRLEVLRDVERSLDLRSSWNFVPKRHEPELRYDVGHDTIDRLVREGCEVGVHGLHHDGRDLASLAILEQRLPAIRAAADRWGAVGFRSPATHRVWSWMPLLGFDYDSSYPDTDPFEPRAGGCCSVLPFLNGDLVELPITLTQDHTLFAILGERDERVWVTKTEYIRRRDGMALVLTHPDYADGEPLVRSYRSFLERYRDDPTVWHALPREVSAWWRRRMASVLERDGTGWRIVGPAAGEGSVQLLGQDGAPTEGVPWLVRMS